MSHVQGQHDGTMPPYFRFLTIMAFHVFIQEQVDVVILEVGIGGTYDCTNIVRYPVVCGVSSLGIDHTSILGDTIDKIAWHKAGIFKNGVSAFTVPQPESAVKVLKDRAMEIKCPLYMAPPLDRYLWAGQKMDLGIPGRHQVYNGSLAMQLANFWLKNHDITLDERRRGPLPDGIEDASLFEVTPLMAAGLKACNWPGRNQKVRGPNITYYLDGAHTDNSIQTCAEWFISETACEEAVVGGPVARVLLFNSTGDRKPENLLEGLLGCKFDYAVFCPNVLRVSGKLKEDVVDVKATMDSQLKRCADNRNAWLSLCASHRGRSALSQDPNEVPSGTSNNNNNDVFPTQARIFSSIVDSLHWVSRGQDDRTANGLVESSADLPRCLQTAQHVFVLCTGSLHLVGDILSLLDPHVCDK